MLAVATTLPARERGEDGPEADDAAGRDDDEIDVVAGREVSASARARRAAERRDAPRPEPGRLLGEERSRSPGRERDDLERVRMAAEHVERLAADRAGRAEDGDAHRRAAARAQRNAATT